jgi:hypothetical protein
MNVLGASIVTEPVPSFGSKLEWQAVHREPPLASETGDPLKSGLAPLELETAMGGW